MKTSPPPTTLADPPVNANEVFAHIYGYCPKSHEFFQDLGIDFKVLSQMFILGTPIWHASYPLTIKFHY
jgi:hypothetical protein